MKKKTLLSLILVTAIGFSTALIGCGSSEKNADKSASADVKDGGTIVFCANGNPGVLNPMYGNDRATMTIDNAIFSPLLVMDGDKITYYLADSLKHSEDYLTYTLTLKKDLKWDDGKPLTADDVVFTLDKILDPSQNSMLRSAFLIDNKAIKYKKINDTTVEFTLPKVSMSFEASLSGFAPIPKHIFDGATNIAKSDKNEHPIGSGPYKFESSSKGESVTLVRNDNYFAEKAHIDKVVYRILEDGNSAKNALLNGEISAMYLKPQDMDKFKDKFNIVIFNEGMLNNIVFNCKSPTIAKKEVRQAIAYALNKEELIKASNIDTKYAESAYSIFTPDVPGYTTDVEKYETNVDKAKQLMEKAGVKEAKLKIAYPNGAKSIEAEGLVAQQELKKIGITLELVPMERSAFYQKLWDPEHNDAFDLAFNGYVMGSCPNGYLPLFTKGHDNISSCYESSVDKLWVNANTETNKEKRDAMYKEIQQKTIDNLPIYPVDYPKSIVALDKNIGGVEEAKTVPIYMFQDLSKLYLKNIKK